MNGKSRPLSHTYFGLTRGDEWLDELSFSRLECGVHDRLPGSEKNFPEEFRRGHYLV